MKAKFLAAAALLGGLVGMPPATGNITAQQMEQQVPRQTKDQQNPRVQPERRVGFSSRKYRLGGVYRVLNQRQRRKLLRQVPQLSRKKR